MALFICSYLFLTFLQRDIRDEVQTHHKHLGDGENASCTLKMLFKTSLWRLPC